MRVNDRENAAPVRLRDHEQRAPNERIMSIMNLNNSNSNALRFEWLQSTADSADRRQRTHAMLWGSGMHRLTSLGHSFEHRAPCISIDLISKHAAQCSGFKRGPRRIANCHASNTVTVSISFVSDCVEKTIEKKIVVSRHWFCPTSACNKFGTARQKCSESFKTDERWHH